MNIHGIVKITNEKFLNLYKITYTDRKKQEKNWIIASRNQELDTDKDQLEQSADAVVIVPFHIHEKKLVIIREFRVSFNGYQYGMPAGLIEDKEPLVSAARRELMEETGLCLTRVITQSPVTYSSSGLTDETLCLLYVECDGTPSRQFLEGSEDIDVVMVSRKQAQDLLEEKHIHFDVKTWIILKDFARGCDMF